VNPRGAALGIVEESMETYRERLYRSYLETMESLPPVTAESLRGCAPYLRAMIRKHFPASRDVDILDLGCGYGAVLYFCRREGFTRVLGVDRSPQQVRTAAQLGIEGVREGDLLDTLTSLPDGSQDVVVAFDVLEHFAKEELLPLCDEVQRVLRPGGRWIIHVPNGESPFHGRIRYGDFTHETIFTRTSLAQVLHAAGFAEVWAFEDKPIVHGLTSLWRRVLWECFRPLLLLYLAVETGSFDRQTILSQSLLAVAVRP
jgi:SAM-dependent methyltransferase